ncbi:MAG: PepSY-associated TM helix domain-containing protein [Pseudomonadota bacterium]
MKITISDDFRASMNWLHTWAGVAVSCFLFMIFWMGSLAVYDREIDQWMKPEMRIAATGSDFSYETVIDNLKANGAANSPRLFISAPSERDPLIFGGYQTDDGFERGYFDPVTMEPVELTESFAGTSFFYPFHYSLHLPAGIGYWIVGFSAMAMLVLIVSGIFIHRKIVQDFFTFRPKTAARRSTLDLHNMSSLMALPLHVLFPLTGLMIFFSIYLPWSSSVVFGGDQERKFEEAFAIAAVEPSGDPAPSSLAIDQRIAEVEARWAAKASEKTPGAQPKADSVNVQLANDANAYLTVREVFPSRAVSMSKNITSIALADGEVLSDLGAGPAKASYAWLAGAHFIQFDSWALRALYFAGGLLGALMIASGLMFWIQSRIRKGALEPRSVRIVRGLSIGSISGIILASGVYLVANRLIPAGSDGFGMGRANFEVMFFYIVWIASFVHAGLRGKFAWREQCLAIAPVAVAAVILNWITTGDHPIAAAGKGLTQVWSMDLVLLASAGAAMYAASRLKVPADQVRQARRELSDIPPEALPAE